MYGFLFFEQIPAVLIDQVLDILSESWVFPPLNKPIG